MPKHVEYVSVHTALTGEHVGYHWPARGRFTLPPWPDQPNVSVYVSPEDETPEFDGISMKERIARYLKIDPANLELRFIDIKPID